MGVVAWVVWGLVVGVVARMLHPGRQRLGVVLTVVLGIAGSLVGGLVATEALDVADTDELDLGSFFVAVLASVLLLAIYDRVDRLLPDRTRGEIGRPGR